MTDSTGKRLKKILGLSSGEADELGAGEGESSSNKDRAEALEAVSEGARIIPEAGAPILIVEASVWASTKYKNQSNDYEDDGSGELQARRLKLFLSVSQCSENVDNYNECPKKEHPDSNMDRFSIWPVP